MADDPRKDELKMVCARIPRALHNELRRVAFDRDESVQDVVAMLVQRYVDAAKGARK